MNRKWFTIITLTLVTLIVTLVFMNEYSIYQATELCREVGGLPGVDRDFLPINWSFTCIRP
ncbi:hypothetical protein [Salipaludibacillus aurantiacus]|uniref:Uncharacterized protein n=1 Tax=Salipaludibacillus aurantiacus TaxID=1601833 RepID=A0A1H9TRG1_9BACI|nr:hypothetical protein [Salipaludibacillus aurantiacus]SER99775.1 hypothetical protein SAMN05518684_10640 [Salipaludibacillus aurantiacus]